ncbi:MAG: SCP-2 sterol transfer family protein [Gammaproteobacteria bacterium]|nr:MAG: SCP-2 sterol transfer family protein [Gammaproteobacteria bacterium]
MAEFLTDAWFEMVTKQTKEFGDLNLTPAMQNIHLNVQVSDANCETSLCFKNGEIHKGIDETAETTVVLPLQLLVSMIKKMDTNMAMKAFIEGDIKVLGDMSQLMALRMARVSDEQKALLAKILLKTNLVC